MNMANFQQSTSNIPNWDFDGVLSSKIENAWTQNLQLSVMTMKNNANNWRGIDLLFQNWHEKFDEFWREHPKASKICTLIRSFWTKCIMLELKRYNGVMFLDTKEWCKIWRKTDLWFGIWHEKFGKCLLESLKIRTLMGSFYRK